MLLSATQENQRTTYHVNKNIRTYIFFTTLLVNVILSKKVQGMKCFPKNIMVSNKSQGQLGCTNWSKLSRTSRPEVFCKEGVFKKLTKFTGKNSCWKTCNSIKKRLQHWGFLLNFVTFLRTPIWQNICKVLLLT